jgi:hypothetical protein
MITGVPTYTLNTYGIIEALPATDLVAQAHLTINDKKVYYGEFISRVIDCSDMFGSVAEYIAILWLLQRTFAYGKRKEWVYLNQVMQGVYSGDERIQCPMGLAHNVWRNAAKKLHKIGFIKRKYHNGRDLKIEVCMEALDTAMTTISKLKTPKSYKKRTNHRSNQGHGLCQKRDMACVKKGRLKKILIQEDIKEVISKDITSDFSENEVETKTQEECNSCTTDESLPICSTSEALASLIEHTQSSSMVFEEMDAPQGAVDSSCSMEEIDVADATQEDTTSPAMETLDAAVAAVKTSSQSALEKSAESIFNKTTRKNVAASWKLLLPAYGHIPRPETLSAQSFGSLTQSDKSMRNDAYMLETEMFANIPDVMEWALKVWTTVIVENFAWTKKYNTVSVSTTPSLDFFCRHYSKIAVLFDDTIHPVIVKEGREGRKAAREAVADYRTGVELRVKVGELQQVVANKDRELFLATRKAKRLAEALMTPQEVVAEPKAISDEQWEDIIAENVVVPLWDELTEEQKSRRARTVQNTKDRIAKLEID